MDKETLAIKEQCIAIVQFHVEGAMEGLLSSCIFMDTLQELNTSYLKNQPASQKATRALAAIVLGTGAAMGFDMGERLIDYVAGVMAVYTLLLDASNTTLQ